MRRALRRFALTCLPLLFAFSIFATNSPAPADTNFVDPAITDDNAATKQLTEVLNKNGIKTDSLLDEHFIFASMFWGAVAGGYLLYARKQREVTPLIGGIAMMAVSFMVTSWFWMSLASIAIMIAVWRLCRQGY
ncbi:MAG: hypothetical protein WCK57_01320 [Verrucomicrobiae bacterium]